MISDRNTYGYIGGSDANRIYGSFSTKTFKSWWDERKTGIKLSEFSTIDTAVGNIMESKVLDFLGIPQSGRDVFIPKEGTIAGINTDAFFNGIYNEVKTCLPEMLLKYLQGRKIEVAYRRQLAHGLYVTDTDEARIHFCPMTPEEKENPFGIDVSDRIRTFIFKREDFDLDEHHKRIMYLTKCFNNGEQPTNNGYKQFF